MEELTEAALVAAPPEAVWRDFTDAASLEQWLWPARFEASAIVELAPRGTWAVRSAPTGMAVVGEVLAFQRPSELRIAWRWEGEEHGTDVSVSLEPAADRSTRVTVVHTGFRNAVERDDHITGWRDCLDRLVQRHA